MEQNPFVAPATEVADIDSGVDSVFKLNLFSPQGRIGRVRYLAYSMGLSFLLIAIGVVLTLMLSPIAIFPVYVVMIVIQFMLAIKRCHDFDVSGWLSLIIFVPLANFALLFVPGTDGANRFGNKTPPNGAAAWVAIALAVAVPVIGILAAIAIPAYQGYVTRAQSVQVR